MLKRYEVPGVYKRDWTKDVFASLSQIKHEILKVDIIMSGDVQKGPYERQRRN